MTELRSLTATPEETEALRTVATRTANLLAAAARMVPSPPVEGSPVGRAYKAGLREAFDLAQALMFSAEDHLRAILLVIGSGPLPAYALYTMLRAAGEADVRCRHLLDPNLTAEQRLGRELNERLANLEEQRKALPREGTHYLSRVAYLEQRAISNGVAVLRRRPKNGKRQDVVGFGEARKSEIELFATYFSAGSGAFRFLSGYVHSKPWIWLRRDRAAASDTPGLSSVEIDLDILLFSSLLTAVADLHDHNVANWLKVHGYSPEVWEQAKQESAGD